MLISEGEVEILLPLKWHRSRVEAENIDLEITFTAELANYYETPSIRLFMGESENYYHDKDVEIRERQQGSASHAVKLADMVKLLGAGYQFHTFTCIAEQVEM